VLISAGISLLLLLIFVVIILIFQAVNERVYWRSIQVKFLGIDFAILCTSFLWSAGFWIFGGTSVCAAYTLHFSLSYESKTIFRPYW
jgi:membrane protease YdiL (CAAX protease family)